MDAVNVKINGLVFDRANDDANGDVLYLARGETSEASDAALTPEGHGIRYDSEGHVRRDDHQRALAARTRRPRDDHPAPRSAGGGRRSR
jgi:hypothetical protein